MQKHVYFGKTNSYILNIGSDNICNMEAYGAFLTHNILLTQNQNHLYFRFKEVLFLFFFFWGGRGSCCCCVFVFVCLFVCFFHFGLSLSLLVCRKEKMSRIIDDTFNIWNYIIFLWDTLYIPSTIAVPRQ